MLQKPIHSKAPAAGLAALFLASWLMGLCGCQSHSSRITYEAGPSLAPADLGLPETACEATGFLILEQGASSGRFPTALAVAKLGSTTNGDGSPSRPVTSLKEEQAVRWNSLFDTTPAIREAIVLNERTPGPPLRGLPAVVAAARRLHAGLCLVYGPAASGPDEAALIGALLDSKDGHVLAQIQARATSADYEVKRPEAIRGDLRHLDLEYLAASKFQRLVRRCVIELITRDSPPKSQPSSPWGSASQPAEGG